MLLYIPLASDRLPSAVKILFLSTSTFSSRALTSISSEATITSRSSFLSTTDPADPRVSSSPPLSNRKLSIIRASLSAINIPESSDFSIFLKYARVSPLSSVKTEYTPFSSENILKLPLFSSSISKVIFDSKYCSASTSVIVLKLINDIKLCINLF